MKFKSYKLSGDFTFKPMKMHFRTRGIQRHIEHMHISPIVKDTAYVFMQYPTNHMSSFKTTCCSYFCNFKKSAILKRKSLQTATNMNIARMQLELTKKEAS